MRSISRLIWVFALFCAFILAILLITPTVLSTQWGNRQLLRLINSHIPGYLSAQNIHIQWFGGQSATDLELTDPLKNPVFSAKKLTTEAKLWTLLWGWGNLGRTELDTPELIISFDAQGLSNLKATIGELLPEKRSAHLPLVVAALAVTIPSDNSLTGNFIIHKGTIHFLSMDGQDIYVNELELEAILSKAPSALTLQGSGKTVQGSKTGSLATNISLKRTEGGKGPLIQRGPAGLIVPAPGVTVDGILTLDRLPVGIIDQLVALKAPEFLGLFPALLGPTVDLKGEAHGTGPQAPLTLNGKTQTAALSLEKAEGLTGNLALSEVELNHPLLGKLSLKSLKAAIAAPDIEGPITIDATANVPHGSQAGRLVAKAIIEQLINEQGKVNIQGSKVDLHLEANAIPVSLVEHLSKSSAGSISDLIGPSLSIELNAVGSPARFNVAFTAHAAMLTVNPVLVSVGDTIQLTKPTTAILAFTPPAWKQIIGESTSELSTGTQTLLEINSLSGPNPFKTQDFSLGNLTLDATLTSPTMAWDGVPMFDKIVVDSLRLSFDGQLLKKGKFSSSLKMSFPSQISKPSKLLGSALPMTVEGQYAIDDEGDLDVQRLHIYVQARYLLLEALLAYNKRTSLQALAPIVADYIVAPEVLATLSPELAAQPPLRGPFSIRSYITELIFDITPEEGLTNFGIDGRSVFSTIHLAGDLSPEIRDFKGKFSLSSGDRKKVDLHFAGETAFAGSNVSGRASIDLTADNFWQKRGLDLSAANVFLRSELLQFPVPALLLLFPYPAVPALFGNRIDATLNANITQSQGPVDLHITSDFSQAAMAGKLNAGTLSLRETMEVTATVTPALGEAVLQFVNPFLLTSLRAESPIRFRVEPQGFSLSVAPFQPGTLHMSQASAEFGKIWVKNSGPVNLLLNMFKNPQLTNQQELQVWSTPVFVTSTNGVVHYARTDTMIGTDIQAAFWGRVNLWNRRASLNFAIPGWSLRKLVGVSDIPDSYYLVIPAGGTLPTIKVDFDKVAPRVAGLLARKVVTGGPIIHGVLDLLSGHAKEQENVPPPTTQPFPWANDPRYVGPSQK